MIALIRLLRDKSGVAAIEYALLAAFIALSIVASLEQLGGEVNDGFEKAEKAFPGGGNGNGNGNGKGKGKGKK